MSNENKNKTEVDTTGMSFTQALRAQGLTKTEEKQENIVDEIIETTKNVVQEVSDKIEKTIEAVQTNDQETTTPNTNVDTTGMSFTQALRAQGLTKSDSKVEPVQTAPEPKTKENKEEPKVEENKQEKENKKPTKDDGEVKTFIDLIRSEGLL